jgi:hypothetical protein
VPAITQAPATLDVIGVAGDALTVTVGITENGADYPWTGVTVTTGILSSGVTQATNWATSTPTDGVLVLSLTNANTTTLGANTFQFFVQFTKAGATRSLIAGTLTVMAAGWGGTSTSTATIAAQSIAVTGQVTGAQGQWDTAQTINAQTGTTYSLVAGDVGKLVTLTNASAITLTVPSGLGLSNGTRIDLAQLGAGQVTVAASGTTINASPGLKLRAQYSAATLIQTAANTFLLVGDLSA